MNDILVRLGFTLSLFAVWGGAYFLFLLRQKKKKPNQTKGRQQFFSGFYATLVFFTYAVIMMAIAWKKHWM